MCCFRRQRGKLERGLLKEGEFPIPIPRSGEFGGDVIIGWRTWHCQPTGHLGSPIFSGFWTPDKPLQASGLVSHRTGVGIYCRGDTEKDKREAHSFGLRIYGRVALWGRVLTFDPNEGGSNFWRPPKGGAMGQFGYPIELYCSRQAEYQKVRRLWEPMGVLVHKA